MLWNHDPIQLGPFDDLLACEKAASMSYAAAREMGYKKVGTVCVNTKNYTYESKK
jgi:hypothetical protein